MQSMLVHEKSVRVKILRDIDRKYGCNYVTTELRFSANRFSH
jgi:hypothetical protein